jgi:hypothetical protein
MLWILHLCFKLSYTFLSIEYCQEVSQIYYRTFHFPVVPSLLAHLTFFI